MNGWMILTFMALIVAGAALGARWMWGTRSRSSIRRRDAILGPAPTSADASVDRDRVRVAEDLVALRGRSPHN